MEGIDQKLLDHCRFTSMDCPKGSVYLGRPWRNFAQTVLIHCELGEHVHPQGFHDWKKAEAHSAIFYGEYQNFGQGADRTKRADFARQLEEKEAKRILSIFA